MHTHKFWKYSLQKFIIKQTFSINIWRFIHFHLFIIGENPPSLSWTVLAGSVSKGCHRWHCGEDMLPGVCRLPLPVTLLTAWPFSVLVTLSPHPLLAHHSPRHSYKIWKFPDFFIPSSRKLCLPFPQVWLFSVSCSWAVELCLHRRCHCLVNERLSSEHFLRWRLDSL